MPQIIISPDRQKPEAPVVFIAGPIQGARDWQADAIRILSAHDDIAIASPRRADVVKGELPRDTYHEQVDWEHEQLGHAIDNGVIMFWLAKETEHDCTRAYAQTTRFELGEAFALHRLHGVKIVIGIEDGFTGARYIRRTVTNKSPDVAVCVSLEETCAAAHRLARGRT